MLSLCNEQYNRLLSPASVLSFCWTVGGVDLRSKVLAAIKRGEFVRPTGQSQLDAHPMYTTRDVLGYIADNLATSHLVDAVAFLEGKGAVQCTAA